MLATILLRPNLMGDATRHTYLPDSHEAHTLAAAELLDDLSSLDHAEIGQGPLSPSAGKGIAGDIALILGTPGAIAGAVRIFHLWLTRDRNRSLTIIVKQSQANEIEIRIEGEVISEQAIHTAVQALLSKGEEPSQ